MRNVSSELSLGAICLGDSLERVYEVIGSQERIYDNNDGFIRHNYPDMEVVIKNNIVEALVSKTEKVETKRGLHQNSTRQEVITTYGRDYELSEMNGNTLLEYPFISLHGKKSLLRFALKNEVVEYISVRTISDEQQTPKPAEQEDTSMQVFRQYWDKLNNRDFAGAYNLMTDKQQNQMGEFENYRSGYNEMIENSLTDVRIIEKTDSFIHVSYTLQAKDRVNGQIKVQIFQGNAFGSMIIASQEKYEKCLATCNKAAEIYRDSMTESVLQNAKFFGQTKYNDENLRHTLALFGGALIYGLLGMSIFHVGPNPGAGMMLTLSLLLFYSGIRLTQVSFRPYWQINKFFMTGKRERSEQFYIWIGNIFAFYLKWSIKISIWIFTFIMLMFAFAWSRDSRDR